MMGKEDEEGLEFKRNLMRYIQSNNIDLDELKSVDISSSDPDDDLDSQRNETTETSNPMEKSAEDEAKKLQTKYLEVRETLDQIPLFAAKLNTELEMMSKCLPVTRSFFNNQADLETFIFKFKISFEWENKSFLLPIRQIESIEKLNSALAHAPTYETIVSFCFSYVYFHICFRPFYSLQPYHKFNSSII